MDLTENLSESNSVLFATLKSKVSPILASPAHRHFTDHTATHSERVIDVLGRILEDQNRLTQDEIFILLAAAYLHDLGMQIRIEDVLDYPDIDKLLQISKVTKKALKRSEKDRLFFIRQWHHLFSYYMITDRLKDEIGLAGYRYINELALVAQGHREDINKSELYNVSNAINIKLLSALLSLADVLDCDHNRINLDLLSILSQSQS